MVKITHSSNETSILHSIQLVVYPDEYSSSLSPTGPHQVSFYSVSYPSEVIQLRKS